MAGNRNLSSKRFYVAIAAWLVLVIVGGLCTWYGWFGADRASKQETDGATPSLDLTATAVAQAEETQPTAIPPTPAESTTSSTPVSTPLGEDVEGEFGYGIAGNFVGGGDPGYWIGQVESLGLGWVKQQVRWKDFSPAPDEVDWSGFDAVVEEANRRDIKVMFSVVDAPDWARSYTDENPEGAPPDDLTVFADFLGQMVDRYQGRLHAIEVWNEQNLDREWDTPEGVDAEAYVEMLQVAYQAIKSQDPDIIVISGALSPTAGRQTDPDNPDRVIWMDDFDYMDQMIDAGLLDYCDCVGAHHNGINMPPNVEWDEGYDNPDAQFRGPFDDPHHSWSFKSTLWGYHERIQEAGGDTPLCVTEFGWATAEGFDGHPPGFEFALDNSLQDQAEWNVQAFKLMRKWGFVRMAFLWNLNYSQLGWGPEDPNAPYAIIDFNGAGRPAFGAIGTMDKP